MRSNNSIPNLKDIVKIEFNWQDLYDVLENNARKIEQLEIDVQKLKDANDT